MKTTLVLDDALYQRVKVVATERNRTVSSVVEEALVLMLNADAQPAGPSGPMPSWDLGQPRIDVDDARAVREALDIGRPVDALR